LNNVTGKETARSIQAQMTSIFSADGAPKEKKELLVIVKADVQVCLNRRHLCMLFSLRPLMRHLSEYDV